MQHLKHVSNISLRRTTGKMPSFSHPPKIGRSTGISRARTEAEANNPVGAERSVSNCTEAKKSKRAARIRCGEYAASDRE